MYFFSVENRIHKQISWLKNMIKYVSARHFFVGISSQFFKIVFFTYFKIIPIKKNDYLINYKLDKCGFIKIY